MRTTRIASFIHKWLALLMAVQILFWFASGLFFAVFPIERVRSEHMKAEAPEAAIAVADAAAGLQRIAGAAAGERIEVRTMLGRPVAQVSPRDGRPRLYDLRDGRLLSPLPPALAAAVAEADHAGAQRAARVELVTAASTEYRAVLPAWRVSFDDGEARALYVAQDTGLVTARRSALWRTYDFLWSLHIMDFKGHEDFNSPLLIAATALALLMAVTGIVLFPVRLGLSGWLRLKRRRQGAAGPQVSPPSAG
ncbi:MAG TPA: PepSY domain-containing protein [Allosphingosinicella sp.]|jgi:hypothetical protein